MSTENLPFVFYYILRVIEEEMILRPYNRQQRSILLIKLSAFTVPYSFVFRG